MLNAFRHQRKKREGMRQGSEAPRCAQRLSASEEETQQNTPTPIPRCPRCSTPFGIRGRNAPSDFAHVVSSPEVVLNAFRHQRKKRSPSRSRRGYGSASAQRLSASEEETPVPRVPDRFPVGVLNAFRHQRKKRHHHLGRLQGGERVLNAFRHQRKKRNLDLTHHGLDTEVLNAFRHQRKKRRQRSGSRARYGCAQRLSASEEETLPPQSSDEGSKDMGAQRLSASEEETPESRRSG